MDLVSTICCLRIKSRPQIAYFFGIGEDYCDNRSSSNFSTQSCSRYGGNIKAFASQNKTKKSRRQGNTIKQDKNLPSSEKLPDENDGLDVSSSTTDELEVQTSVTVPSRSVVLQACTVTSGLIGALGVLARQGSHIASTEGLPINDCSTNITFHIESWHLGLIAGSVIMVSSFRFVLLKTWPDFAESSEAANRQIGQTLGSVSAMFVYTLGSVLVSIRGYANILYPVLTSLEPLDYLVVAFLPGISEEILFRGALLPLFGANWISIIAVAALFGVLHLGNGRKYSFAIWATFVGLVYGYATILSSSITVPMASHALNNLVGGTIWRYLSNSSKEIS